MNKRKPDTNILKSQSSNFDPHEENTLIFHDLPDFDPRFSNQKFAEHKYSSDRIYFTKHDFCEFCPIFAQFLY